MLHKTFFLRWFRCSCDLISKCNSQISIYPLDNDSYIKKIKSDSNDDDNDIKDDSDNEDDSEEDNQEERDREIQ